MGRGGRLVVAGRCARAARPYLGAMFEHWPQSLAGSVEDLRAHGDDSASLHRLSGRIGALSVEPGGAGPAVAGIDLELGLSGDRAAIDLSGAPQGDWPRMIRSPVSLQSIRGRVTVSPQAIEMNNLRIGHEYADGRAHGWVWLGGERAFLDFHVVADRIEEVDPRPFLPHGRIPPRTMDWLDQALVYVGSASGGLNYHVRLGRKFRRWHAGDFQAWVEFADADLDYWPGGLRGASWTAVSNSSADAWSVASIAATLANSSWRPIPWSFRI